MNERICTTDLRGKPKWTAADYARSSDLWIVGDPWPERPPVAGRVLAYINPAVLFYDGVITGEPGSFSRRLEGLPLLPLSPLWTSPDGRQVLRALDMTARNVSRLFLEAVRASLMWADGVLFCYFTSLDFVDPGRYPLEYWSKWDSTLGLLANGIRDSRPGFLCVAQQFHLAPPTTSCNGLYLEGNGPYEFRYTPEQHEDDARRLRDLIRRYEPSRQDLWVQEVRKPELYSAAALRSVVDWATRLDFYVSIGRDETARGRAGLPA